MSYSHSHVQSRRRSPASARSALSTLALAAAVAAVSVSLLSASIYCYRRYYRPPCGDKKGKADSNYNTSSICDGGVQRSHLPDCPLALAGKYAPARAHECTCPASTFPPEPLTSDDDDSSSRLRVALPPIPLPKGASISISLNNIVMWNPSPSPSSPNYAFTSQSLRFLNTLLHLSSSTLPYPSTSPPPPTVGRSPPPNRINIHLICTVSSDAQKQQILDLLSSSGLFAKNALDRRRVLFCETVLGRVHVVKQLGCLVHCDDDDAVLTQLLPHVKRLIRVKRGKGTSIEADKRRLSMSSTRSSRRSTLSSVGNGNNGPVNASVNQQPGWRNTSPSSLNSGDRIPASAGASGIGLQSPINIDRPRKIQEASQQQQQPQAQRRNKMDVVKGLNGLLAHSDDDADADTSDCSDTPLAATTGTNSAVRATTTGVSTGASVGDANAAAWRPRPVTLGSSFGGTNSVTNDNCNNNGPSAKEGSAVTASGIVRSGSRASFRNGGNNSSSNSTFATDAPGLLAARAIKGSGLAGKSALATELLRTRDGEGASTQAAESARLREEPASLSDGENVGAAVAAAAAAVAVVDELRRSGTVEFVERIEECSLLRY
ncbi:hypothetical protein HDU82_001606 [Entophlyctis luteolus]|nr:hypothetical protein HDU82_001606 [Entophlyctis luteolus]